MEKKDWRERLQHDIGFLYKFDGNESWTDVHDKVLDFIEQEKQKSREATLKEILGKSKKFLEVALEHRAAYLMCDEKSYKWAWKDIIKNIEYMQLKDINREYKMREQREIKFRAWSEGLKEMFVNCDINHNGDVTFAWNPKEGSETQIESYAGTKYETDCIPMQYTGLKDKNGVEVYEGDIISDIEHGMEVRKFVVDDIRTIDREFEESNHASEWRVIGNIYENPELLDKLNKLK